MVGQTQVSNGVSDASNGVANVVAKSKGVANGADQDVCQLSEEDRAFQLKFYQDMYKTFGDHDATINFYREYGHRYDEVYLKISYPYKIIRDELTALVTADGKNPADVRVLDIGAGTGLVSEELRRGGFTNIDALDICEVMLSWAKKKGVYTKLHNVGIYCTPTPGIEENEYDALVSCGSFTGGHVKMDTIYEMARIVKKGGVLLYTVKDPDFVMDYMNVQGEAMKKGLVELLFMKKTPYKFDPLTNFERQYCYLTAFRVL